MRKWNALLTVAILLLLLLHAVLGAFTLVGTGSPIVRSLGYLTIVLVLLHAVYGLYSTAHTLKLQKQAGVAYPQQNRLFWARRISGIALLLFLYLHLGVFSTTVDGALRLPWFQTYHLVTQLLLVLTLALHILTNLRPLLLGLGVASHRTWLSALTLSLSLLLLLFAIAFLIYYIRWNLL